MSCGAHIQTKHEIAYADAGLGIAYADNLKGWLADRGVSVYETHNAENEEWEIQKSELRALKDEDYASPEGRRGLDGETIKSFVRSLLEAPTGEYAYVSWF